MYNTLLTDSILAQLKKLRVRKTTESKPSNIQIFPITSHTRLQQISRT